ncbi:MAG: glycosyltransferase family 8 protein [Oscillospiraceae bacterium]
MHSIKPACVNICCACNDNYAPPLAVCLYSLLCNADKIRLYDIVVLHSDISHESREQLLRVGGLFPNCTLRLVDMTEFHESVKGCSGSYITAETNYRLAILGELFSQYDRVLYLDCDTIVEGDISQLFDTDLCGNAVGGAVATDIRLLRYTKKGFFVDNKPYNIENYAKTYMDITDLDRYFNAGVTLFDLRKCRELTSEQDAVELLNRRKWMYNDQDVLNMLFRDNVHIFDIKWNYTVNIEHEFNYCDGRIQRLMADVRRNEYGIIHYTGGGKPWNKDVPLGEHYHKYADKLKEVLS